MLSNTRQPCDEGVVCSQPEVKDCGQATGRWVLVAAILGSSITFIDGTVVNVALPVLQRELGASVAEAQWIVESYALMLAALILVGGSSGDALGRRRVFSVGVSVFCYRLSLVWIGPKHNSARRRERSARGGRGSPRAGKSGAHQRQFREKKTWAGHRNVVGVHSDCRRDRPCPGRLVSRAIFVALDFLY